jgi:membrane protease YdiL (CAAX protease family)
VIPPLTLTPAVVVLLGGVALYLAYHYGAAALVARAQGAAWGVYAGRVLGFVALGVVPGVYAEVALPGGLVAHGLSTPRMGPSLGFVGLVLVLVLPVVVLAARRRAQWQHYPQLRQERWDTRTHAANTASWALYLLGYELYFRGVLTFVLVRELGTWPGLAVMTALYVAVHLPKPAGETVGTLPMGLVFGLTALASGSMWPVWLGHVLIAVGSDEAAMAWWTRAGRPPR